MAEKMTLEPCPFCGRAPIAGYGTCHDVTLFNVRCRCGAGVNDFDSEDAAAEAWNRRAISPAQAEGWRDIASAPENELVDVWVGSDETGFRYANAINLGGIWCDRNGYRLTLKGLRLWHKAPPTPPQPEE